MPQYCTKKTDAEMAEESKKATAQGLKNLAESFLEEEFKESDSDSEKEEKPKSRSNARLEKLETRIHYMQLELLNAKVDLDDANEKLLIHKKRQDLHATIDKEFAILNGMDSYLNDRWDLSMPKLEARHKEFLEKSYDQLEICQNAVEEVELPHLRYMMHISLNEMRNKMIRIESSIHFTIMFQRSGKVLLTIGFLTCFAIVVIAVAIEYNNVKRGYYL